MAAIASANLIQQRKLKSPHENMHSGWREEKLPPYSPEDNEGDAVTDGASESKFFWYRWGKDASPDDGGANQARTPQALY